ncbi:hypothetical protein AXF42_Ash017739 [Apostasia shenzhenica]|uniref:Uncharacterized protein n=1 Tax=Apostasia shenzhenica TaxID=1088818 RepID=A0A2I0B682_9ASPA|nr:hypothetical protein AXF42_Ash017739 [Apostasia shenzhenica]
MDPKLEAMLTTIMAKTDCLDDIKIKLDEVSDRVARLEVKRCTHTSEIEVDQPRREPRLVPIAPIPTLIARPIETIGDQSNFLVKEILNEFSTEAFILPEALKLVPISIYIADPSLAEEYEKYEDEMHEEDSYRIEVESQIEKIVIEPSHEEEQVIDSIEATESSYCDDNTIDHIEMIICHDHSEVNRFDLVEYSHAYPRSSKSSTPINQYRQMVHENEWLATRVSDWCAIQFARYFWRTLWHLLGTASLVTLTYFPYAYNQNLVYI